jgi:peroxiredoxin
MVVVLFLGLAWINLSRVQVGAATDQTIEAPKAGFLAPDFTLTTTDGETVTLSALRGKPVIVNFWATWCPPCRAEMPAFEQVWQRFNRGDVMILGVNQGENATAVVQFARDYVGTSFPLLLDTRTEVGARYGIRALPTTFFIDADGRIQDVKVGGPLDVATILGGIGKAGSGN